MEKSGAMPRMLICEARPPVRCAATPGKREMDSAMLVSGSLPRSSAEMASTMESAFFLTLMALSMPRRMPVMTTVSVTPAGVVCAWASPLVHSIAATAAATGVACSKVRARRRAG